MSAKFIKFEMTIIYNKNINIFIANCQSLQLAIQSNPIHALQVICLNNSQQSPPAIQGFIAFTPMEEPTDR
jgi:hypothetical protein